MEGLPSAASIFTAEMYAIKDATEKLIANSKPGSYTIFSLSDSVLLALELNTLNSAMVTTMAVVISCSNCGDTR